MSMFYRIISLLGGLALFLYGMRIMGDGLKSSSGGALKSVLAYVTDKPVKGFILGLIVTCMIQSSTATIVLTVGLVGAGFLKFSQSAGIVLGANVGTAITAQIIRLMDVEAGESSLLYFFKSDNLAPMALIIGIVLIMFIHSRRSDVIGTVCMGFGILFVGLMNMSAAVSSLSGMLSRVLVSFEDNYLLGFLAGVLVTGVIQSSSAVIGILQSVASSVGVTFCGVFAIIIGVNIGDCITTYLVCRIGAKREQIRTCLVHIIYNVIAATLLIVCITLLRLTGILSDQIWTATLRSGGVANVHGLFRLVPAVILLPFSGQMQKLAVKLVPDRDPEDGKKKKKDPLRELDLRLVNNPYLALTESRHLIGRMAKTAVKNFRSTAAQLDGYDPKVHDKIMEREDKLDQMTDAANRYILVVSPYITLEQDNLEQSFQLQAMTCFERIGDLAVNIENNLKKLSSSENPVTPVGIKELKLVFTAVDDILSQATEAFMLDSVEETLRVEPLEEVIDELVETVRNRHLERMTSGLCDVVNGIQYENILMHLERVADQCSDLAVYHLGRYDDKVRGQEHQYIHNLHLSEEPDYMTRFHSSYTKYYSLLDGIEAEEEGKTDENPGG
ncbi:MAG: Na/Pi cotransporter family protein [Lachnospiraceae bacterium]|nr:Na/Pi cotransporter family protein [Lachnospiraceae bacterium]